MDMPESLDVSDVTIFIDEQHTKMRKENEERKEEVRE
jgi:hypothetical protein